MNRRHLHIAVTAGLAAALSLGAAPAFAEDLVDLSHTGNITLSSNEASGGTYSWTLSGSLNVDAVQGEDGNVDWTATHVAGYISMPKGLDVWYTPADGYQEYLGNKSVTWSVEGFEDTPIEQLPAGTYRARATVEGIDPSELTPEVTVILVDGDAIVGVDYSDSPSNEFVGKEASSISGQAVAVCFFGDGATVRLPIVWDPFDESLLEEPSSFILNGHVEGTDITMTHQVNVYRPVSATVDPMWTYAHYEVNKINSYEYLHILAVDHTGQQVEVKYPNADVIWNLPTGDFSYASAGTYSLTGNVPCGSESLPVETTVTVYRLPSDASELDVGEIDTVWTTPGNRPFLRDWVAAIGPEEVGDDAGRGLITFTVLWDEVAPEQYAQEGSFTVRGAVVIDNRFAGGDIIDLGFDIECQVDVAEPVGALVPDVTTTVGVAPEIPATVSVVTSDGKIRNYETVYNVPPTELYSKPGQFTLDISLYDDLYGVVVWTDIRDQMTVTVVDDYSVQQDEASSALLNLTCKQGEIPQLPSTVPVLLANGTVSPATVVWDDVDSSQFGTAGAVVEVHGTIGGSMETDDETVDVLSAPIDVVAKVKVAHEAIKPVVSYIEPQYAFVEKGSAVDVNSEDFGHNRVSAVLSNGEVLNEGVEWDTSNLDMDAAGVYLLKGTVDAEGSISPDAFAANSTAYLYVNVVDSDSAENPDEPVDPDPEPDPTPDPDPTPVPTPDPDEEVTVPETEGGAVTVEPVPAGETATVVTEPDAGQEVRDIKVTDSEGNPVETAVDEDGNVTFEMPEGGATVEVVFGCDGGELCGTHAYPDIDQGQWYHDSVDWAIEEEVFHGYDDGTFGPDDVLTREQAAAVLYNYLGGTEGSADSGLADVAEDWYTDAVNWAVESGVMTGYEGTGTFGVGEALTREQFCAVVAKAMKVDLSDVDTSVLDGFEDAGGVSDWARPAVSWAVQQGIVNGVENPDGTRSLQGPRDITRAEMAAMMLNAVDAGVLVK